ncbi:hypothetical protein Hanom_Chr04g00381871 [Helianthus anomalus]
MCLVVACQFSTTVRQLVSLWFKVPPIFAFQLSDLMELQKGYNGSKKQKKIFDRVVQTVFWSVWKARNAAIFEGKPAVMASVIEEITVRGCLVTS